MPAVLARATAGSVFLTSGWGKLHQLDKVTEFFAELSLPAPAFQATLVSWTELLCGGALLLGLLTRLAAVPVAVTMVVALFTAKAEELEGLADLLATSEFAYLALLVALTVQGAGSLSLDHLLTKRFLPGDAPLAPSGAQD